MPSHNHIFDYCYLKIFFFLNCDLKEQKTLKTIIGTRKQTCTSWLTNYVKKKKTFIVQISSEEQKQTITETVLFTL